MPIEQAVERAVNECIEEGILREFLLTYKAEAIQMSIFEYNEEKEIQLIREAEHNEGLRQGIERGIELGKQEGFELGKQELLAEKVQKKLARGKSIEQIAEDLEETPEQILEYIQKFKAVNQPEK